MSIAPRLTELLPDLYRLRDAEQDGSLAALLELIDGELDRLRDDVDGLYDDAFIETCAEWVVPYIGELLGVQGLHETHGSGLSRRALVANTLRYRRRKGTAAVLEDLARDATGWPARAVEYFALLGWTQNLNHVRPGAGGTADLRGATALELVAGPFDPCAHSVDVRHIDNGRGRHNIANVGIHLWRRRAYRLERVSARSIPGRPGAYRFDPLGLDSPLHHVGSPERDVAHLATEANVPGPIRRRALRDDLRERLAGRPATYFGTLDPALRIWVDGSELGPDQIAVCDLEPADRPAPAGAVATVDPERGRLFVPAADAKTEVEVSWAYGGAGDLGGGPYDRRESIEAAFADPELGLGRPSWQRGVRRAPAAGESELFASLTQALEEWAQGPAKEVALIAVMDSRSYAEDLEITIRGGCTLILAAGDWPDHDPAAYSFDRRLGELDPTDRRPHLLGNLKIRATPGPKGARPATVIVDGFAIEGSIEVEPGSLGHLRVAHCTVLPEPGRENAAGPAAIAVNAEGAAGRRNSSLQVEILRSSCGPVAVSERALGVRIADSIVRGADVAGAAPAITAGELEIERATVLGATAVRAIEASECLFAAPVVAARRQSGCVRYSYVPAGSAVPRRFRCQPGDGETRPPAPVFESTAVGAPGYGQLDPATAAAIAAGAERGGEIGAFNFVEAPQRLAQLQARLAEYVRFGLETGVFLAS